MNAVNEEFLPEGMEITFFNELGIKEVKKIGKMISRGSDRIVYDVLDDKNYVIKHEPHPYKTSYSNVSEYNLYGFIKPSGKCLLDSRTKYKLIRYLCPVRGISEDTKFLLMYKADPLPKKIRELDLPAFTSDIHRGNVGLFNGNIVILDYANANSLPIHIDTISKELYKTYIISF